MATVRPEITGRAAPDSSPLAVTVQRACELSGLGATSIWGFLKDGRLEAVRGTHPARATGQIGFGWDGR